MFDLSGYDFSPVINYPDPAEMKVFDFTQGYDPEYVRSFEWGVGRYDEKRRDMYTAPQYKNRRNIHMGIDIYCKVGEPVFSFYDGKICYKADLDQPGNYGPTIILRYNLNNLALYALYGHLSRASLDEVVEGEQVKRAKNSHDWFGESERRMGAAPPLSAFVE